MCHDELPVKDMWPMVCPNESGCTFSRNLTPKTNGAEDLFEMFDGTFLIGDVCNFRIANPSVSDLNDLMYIRVEYFKNCKATLVKGTSLTDAKALYKIKAG